MPTFDNTIDQHTTCPSTTVTTGISSFLGLCLLVMVPNEDPESLPVPATNDVNGMIGILLVEEGVDTVDVVVAVAAEENADADADADAGVVEEEE